MEDSALIIAEEGPRQTALLKAIGYDKLSVEQRELALAICRRYDLDPLLKHVVMIEGRAYITRDGLMHVAHRSGQFDGIEVTPAERVEGFYRSTCSVFRKDMTRPFVYPGRYPAQGGNAKYAEEMAIKVAEVAALRRAFDVSAPTVEERWEGELPTIEQPPAPTLAERAAARAAAVTAEPEPGLTLAEFRALAKAGGTEMAAIIEGLTVMQQPAGSDAVAAESLRAMTPPQLRDLADRLGILP